MTSSASAAMAMSSAPSWSSSAWSSSWPRSSQAARPGCSSPSPTPGGTVWEVHFQDGTPDPVAVRAVLDEQGLPGSEVAITGADDREYVLIRTEALSLQAPEIAEGSAAAAVAAERASASPSASAHGLPSRSQRRTPVPVAPVVTTEPVAQPQPSPRPNPSPRNSSDRASNIAGCFRRRPRSLHGTGGRQR